MSTKLPSHFRSIFEAWLGDVLHYLFRRSGQPCCTPRAKIMCSTNFGGQELFLTQPGETMGSLWAETDPSTHSPCFLYCCSDEKWNLSRSPSQCPAIGPYEQSLNRVRKVPTLGNMGTLNLESLGAESPGGEKQKQSSVTQYCVSKSFRRRNHESTHPITIRDTRVIEAGYGLDPKCAPKARALKPWSPAGGPSGK